MNKILGNSQEKIKSFPTKLLILFTGLTLFFAILLEIGWGYQISVFRACGFVGILISIAFSCTSCYRQGYSDCLSDQSNKTDHYCSQDVDMQGKN
jgi:succinate-acetate transporter protein